MANDAEYKAIKRRMSKVRVQCGKGSSQEEEEDVGDTGFKDLIKYWKKHGIPIPDEIISDMADENVKLAKAKGQGRRRSRELEDLHMCAATGKLSLDNLDENEEDFDSTSHPTKKTEMRKRIDSVGTRQRTDSTSTSMSKAGLLKKQGSRTSINGTASPSTGKKLTRQISNK